MQHGIISTIGFPGEDPIVEKKAVIWKPASSTDVVKVGQPVCYNWDLAADAFSRTSNPSSSGYPVDANATTYAEGKQTYTARMYQVERPTEANLAKLAWAGVVTELGDKAGATGDKIIIAVPNGAMVPVRTDANCTIGVTVIGPSSGSNDFQICTGDGDPIPAAVVQETVDRSGTAGFVWAKLAHLTAGVLTFNAYFAPVRAVASGYHYGVSIDGTNMLTGTAASKSYVLSVTGYRETAAATGDSNDAMFKLTGNNEAANDTNFVFAGVNAVVNNRSGGTLGRLTNTLSVSLKQGSTTAYAFGLQVDAQDLAATAKTEFGGIDVALNREGLAGTLEYGIQVRTRGTINSDISQALYFRQDATDHGFACLFGVDAATTLAITSASSVTTSVKIPIKIAGVTYYIAAGTTTA